MKNLTSIIRGWFASIAVESKGFTDSTHEQMFTVQVNGKPINFVYRADFMDVMSYLRVEYLIIPKIIKEVRNQTGVQLPVYKVRKAVGH
jgi:hypothetical protein